MFTLEQVDEIHDRLGKASTLADFLHALSAIGVTTSDSFLADGHTTYHGGDGHQVSTAAAHEVFAVAEVADPVAVSAALERHASGEISYVEMSRALAAAGVERWTFDTRALTITYHDLAGTPVLSESVG